MFNHKLFQRKLANGLKVLEIIVPQTELSLITLFFPAGSSADPLGKEGLAHLIEHLLAKKTKLFDKEIDRLVALEKQGIFFNAFTNRRAAYYSHLQLPEKNLNSVKLLIDGVFNSFFNPADLKQEKNIIKVEDKENRQNPEAFIWRLADQTLWPKNLLGRDLFGSTASRFKIKSADINNFKRKFYNLNQACFVFVGPRREPNLIKILNTSFKVKREFKRKVVSTIKLTKNSTPLPVLVQKRLMPTVTLAISYKTPAIDQFKTVIILNLLRDLLGNTWSSKLVKTLRLDRNLVYWVDGEMTNFFQTGYLRFTLTCSKSSAPVILNLALKTIENLADNLTTEELTNIKNYHLASLARQLSDPYELAFWYAWPTVLNQPLFLLPDYFKILKNITIGDLQATAKQLLVAKNRSVVAIGNINDSSLRRYLK